MDKKKLIIISNTSDNSFAIDIAHFCGQHTDISDIIALKNFQNTEFCPRFIVSDEKDINTIGYSLKSKVVAIISTSGNLSRNALAMRNMIIARAAKDNDAEKVILIEPDLYYSCQDRGPKQEHSVFGSSNAIEDRKKFNGQPFTASLYAQLLSTAGVDDIITVHNHSKATRKVFNKYFPTSFFNFVPTSLFAHYLCNSGVINTHKIILCAPDEGATELVVKMKEEILSQGRDNVSLLQMTKARSAERNISMQPKQDSEVAIEDIKGCDVIVFDDMVRTGTTIMKCCRLLKKYKPRRVIFCVTHFHSSTEIRENLHVQYLDEIITTNTVSSILNRDTQGRLRKKIIVLKIEEWVAKQLYDRLGFKTKKFDEKDLYYADISSKNPRSALYRGSF